MISLMRLLLLCFFVCLTTGQTTPPEQKLVNNGQWVESGNRLPDNFDLDTLLPLGTCSARRTIAGVGYPGTGNTCGFDTYDPGKTIMPQIFRDGYRLAVSTDYYQGWHFPDNWQDSPRTPQWAPCDYAQMGGAFNEADYSKMCGQSCGECVELTGAAGTHLYIVNEIGDILAAGTHGISSQGIDFALGWGQGETCPGAPAGDCAHTVIDGHGHQAVTVRRVACPVTGNIHLGIRWFNSNPEGNVELIPMNFRVALRAMFVRGTGSTTWKWVPRTWTNKFEFEPRHGLSGNIYDPNMNSRLDVRFIDAQGTETICSNIDWNSRVAVSGQASRATLDLGCQQADPGVATGPCPPPLPPLFIYSEQVYGWKTCTGGWCECALGSAGCSSRFEGPFLREWRHQFDYGISGDPDYEYSTDCYQGSSKCIDTTTSTASAGFGMQWRQDIIPAKYPEITHLEFAVKCVAGNCASLTVGFDSSNCSPGKTVSPPGATPDATWQVKVIDLRQGFEMCDSWHSVRFNFGSGQRYILDDIRFVCGGAGMPCADLTGGTGVPTTATPTQAPSMHPTVVPGSPTKSPTTKTPSSAPSKGPTKSPTTNSPTTTSTTSTSTMPVVSLGLLLSVVLFF